MVLTKWGFSCFEGTPCCQQSVADFFVSETPWCQQNGAFFFLKARHVVNKVLLISLFQRRHCVHKMGFFCFEGTPCWQQSVADFFVSETPWC